MRKLMYEAAQNQAMTADGNSAAGLKGAASAPGTAGVAGPNTSGAAAGTTSFPVPGQATAIPTGGQITMTAEQYQQQLLAMQSMNQQTLLNSQHAAMLFNPSMMMASGGAGTAANPVFLQAMMINGMSGVPGGGGFPGTMMYVQPPIQGLSQHPQLVGGAAPGMGLATAPGMAVMNQAPPNSTQGEQVDGSAGAVTAHTTAQHTAQTQGSAAEV
jgi:hypothetical protein